MDHYENVYDLLTRMQQDLKSVKKSVNKARKDSLMISSNGNSRQFFAVTHKDKHRDRKLINKDEARIYRLAHRAYEKEFARRLSVDTDLLQEAAARMLPLQFNTLLKDLPKHFDELDPFYVQHPEMLGNTILYPNPSRDEWPREARLTTGGLSPLEWAALPYCENTAYPEHKIHRTSKGVFCRSKSEVALLECFDALKIPYHTDELMRFGMDMAAPDVIGARSDCALIYVEHWGMSGDPGYVEHNLWKLSLYAAADIVIGKNLMITCDDENGALDMKLVEMQIQSIFRI